MPYTLGYTKEGGIEFSIGDDEAPPKAVAGEPIFPTKTLLIVGALAVAGVLLFVLVK